MSTRAGDTLAAMAAVSEGLPLEVLLPLLLPLLPLLPLPLPPDPNGRLIG